MKKQASPETLSELYNNMGSLIKEVSPELIKNIQQKKCLEENSNNITVVNSFLSTVIYVQYLLIELASLYRACHRATIPAEKRYNLKYINCVILEGYKHLYGYGSIIKNSLWIKNIKPLLLLIKDQEFENEYNIIENKIIDFGKNNITDKDQRDLTIHYDINSLLVYRMLIKLSEETEAQRMIIFIDLLQSLSGFGLKFAQKYATSIEVDNNIYSKYIYTINDAVYFENNSDFFYSNLGDSIITNALRLDQCFVNQKLQFITENYSGKLNNDLNSFISHFMQLEKAVILVASLNIDVASAIRTYIKAEYTIEKQLSLKYINTIVYEGFNTLYGLSEKGNLWKNYIYPIVQEYADNQLITDSEELTSRFEALKVEINNMGYKRQLSIHLDSGINKVYDMLHNLNPLLEFNVALKFLNTINDSFAFFTKCLKLADSRKNENFDKYSKHENKTIDNIIKSLDIMPETPEKVKFINTIAKFKSHDFIKSIFQHKKGTDKNTNG